MAIGSSLSGITFSGISSGIDSESIISRLIQIDTIPIQRLQRQQQELQGRQGIMAQFRQRVQAITTAASALANPTAFETMRGLSTRSEVAFLGTTPGASAGTYNLEVMRLAQAHKTSTARFETPTTVLNQSGTMVINGKAVSIAATDTLTTIAQKINGLNAGVVASLINGGNGNAVMTLTANQSGAGNAIQIADLSGSVAQGLGLVTGTAGVRETITNGATSFGFGSASETIQSLFGESTARTGTISINGTNVSFDTGTDSLQALAARITAEVSGVTANVRTVTDGSRSVQKLDISGASTPTFADPNGLLAGLGILQRGYGNELLAAQDASYRLDGLEFTSPTNNIQNVIPGATITLMKGNATTPETTTLILNRDDDAIRRRVRDFVDSFNRAIDFISTNSQFDKNSFQSGPLFGDPTAQQIQGRLSQMLFDEVQGLSGPYRNLASVGFGLDAEGKLTLDEAQFGRAMQADATAVGRLFRVTGEGSNDQLTFVSANSRSVPSGTGFYQVEITQAARRAAYTGEMAQTTASTLSERLRFSGSLFGSQQIDLNIPAGSTAASTVALINGDSRLRDLVTASLDNSGRLQIESRRFGSTSNFSVLSNLEAGSDNSGIGVGSLGTVVTGQDIAGTINGGNATGNGQFLTGSTGNSRAEGVQIQYTGNALGLVGSVRFSRGIGAAVGDLANSFTDSVSGLLTATDQATSTQIESIRNDIRGLQERLTLREQSLRERFLRMEQAIQRIQSQAARFQSASNQRS